MITNSANSRTIGGEISPVKAPFSCQCRFCAPILSVVPTAMASTKGRYGYGGQTIFSTPSISSTPPAFIASIRSRAVGATRFIFQLPATIGIRATSGAKLHQAAGVRHGKRQHVLGRERPQRAAAAGGLVELIHGVEV